MAYPGTSNPITEILINGTWTDVSSYVRQEDGSQGIVITRGRQNEQGRVSASSSEFRLNNRDGRFSNRNPTGTYYGLLPRNTQVRHSAGTGTGDAYLRLPYDDQRTANRAETADKAVLDIVGDLEVRADIRPHAWRMSNPTIGTAGTMIIASKYLITGDQRSWMIYMDYNGKLNLVWSTAGTSGTRVFTTSTAAVPATSGRLSIKVTLDVDNGAAGNTVAFYTATSIGGTYTQLGTSVVTAGVTSIFSSSAKLIVGGGDDVPDIFGDGCCFGGRFYELQVYQGIAGTLRANPKFYAQSIGTTSFSDGLATPNTWTTSGSGARITSDRVRFWGELSSMPQHWDKTAIDAYVPVTAGGLIRRLTQGGSPLRSPMYRQFTQLSGIVGYWPMEDGSTATSLANTVTGGRAASITQVTPSVDSTLPGSADSASLNTVNGSIITAPLPYTGTTGTLSFMVFTKISAFPATQKTLMTIYTTGTARRIEIGLDASNWHIDFYASDGTNLSSTTTAAASISPVGQWCGVNLLIATSGANVSWSARWLPVVTGGTFLGIGPAAFTGSVGRFTQVNIKGGGEANYNGAAFCHLLLSSSDINFVSSTVYQASYAYNGERAATRIARLAAEEGITAQIDGFYNQSAVMGYQTVDTLMNLLYACSDADMGLLAETRDALALSYRTHQDLELRRDATVSMTSYHLAEVPLPTEDDQLLLNDVTVSAPGGSTARYVKSSGALSTAAPPNGAGTYNSQQSLNLAESALTNAASWLVHLGTWDEARYPNIVLGLHRSALTADSTLSESLRLLDAGDTVTLSGMPSWMPPDAVPLLVQGYSEQLLKSLWTITMNTSPAAPYNTGRYGNTDVVGTPRWDTGGSTLNAGITSTATALALAYSVTGNNWSTTAGSYPFDIMVGGERITLTSAPAGSTSPQSYTGVTRSVNGVIKAHNAGEAVKLADTRYYAR
jgi:hypothetical protein